MKKILCLLLSVILLTSTVSFCVSAKDDTAVARMWFCSEINKNTGIGHVFLYFENLTNKTITVGRYKVKAYKTVSVGCFGSEGPRGGGVYYNLESKLTHYRSLKGISTKLTKAQLQKVTNKIRNYNRWDPIFNCYYFAAMGWNAGATDDVPFMLMPKVARLWIQLKGGKSKPFDLFSRKDPVYKQSELKAV